MRANRTIFRSLSRLSVLAALALLLSATVATTTAFAASAFTTAPNPTIVGESGVGQTLAAVPGSWSPNPDSFAYQWFADGLPIDGATGPTYLITAAETCLPITVQVTGSKAGFNDASTVSAATALAEPYLGLTDFPGAPLPAITGTAVVGHTLTAATGAWSPTPNLFTFQWYADGAAIGGATSSSYDAAAGDLGKKISVQVIAYGAGYNSTYRTSAQTAAVTSDFTSAPDPSIVGTPEVGQILAAVTGSWSPTPDSLTYQWYADNIALGGSTDSTYLPTSDVVGKKISVQVTGSKTGYNPTSKASAQTAQVTGNFASAPTPTIAGTPAVGQTLTAAPGSWSPTPDSFGYQWYANGVAINGATASTYHLTLNELGLPITVQATGNKVGFNSVARTSAPTGLVQTAALVLDFTASPDPTITGTPKVGSTLTAVTGSWGPTPDVFTYQWYADNVALGGSTGSTYVPTSDVLGKKISVQVTATKTAYNPLSRASAQTAQVTGDFTSAPTPTIKGTAKVGKTLNAQTGVWSSAPTLGYQWYANGKKIKGATKRSIKLTKALKGKTIKVAVTATKPNYVTLTKTSRATAKVKK